MSTPNNDENQVEQNAGNSNPEVVRGYLSGNQTEYSTGVAVFGHDSGSIAGAAVITYRRSKPDEFYRH